MKIVEGLKYSKDHEWVKVEGNLATIGITDFAQHSLGDIVYIELPELGDTIGKDETFGVVESVKAASDVYLPVSGTVVKINEALVDEPELVNLEPYGKAWLVEISMTEDMPSLLTAQEYEKQLG